MDNKDLQPLVSPNQEAPLQSVPATSAGTSSAFGTNPNADPQPSAQDGVQNASYSQQPSIAQSTHVTHGQQQQQQLQPQQQEHQQQLQQQQQRQQLLQQQQWQQQQQQQQRQQHQQQQMLHQQQVPAMYPQQQQQGMQQQPPQQQQQYVMQQQRSTQHQQGVMQQQQQAQATPQQPMARPVVHTPPPPQEELRVFNFDPQSQTVLQSLGTKHIQTAEVPGYVHGALKEVMSLTGDPEVPTNIQMEYQTLLNAILFEGEEVADHHITFEKVSFQYIQEAQSRVDVPNKPDITAGKAYLTNQRLILLSAEEAKGLSLTSQVSGLNKVYTVTGHKTYNIRYESIPLTCFRGIDVNTACGFRATATVQGIMPDSVAVCLQCCCSGDEYQERWQPLKPLPSTVNNRAINLGVLLPPWGTKCNMQITIDQDTGLADVVKFVDVLQRYSPGLQPESFTIPRQ